MRLQIRWIKDEDGQESMEGRFSIAPVYLGRCTPVSYNLQDRVKSETYRSLTVTECKQKALQIAINDLSRTTGRVLS